MRRKSAREKRSSAQERKYLDRAILRLTRTFSVSPWEAKLTEQQLRELVGLVQARRRVP